MKDSWQIFLLVDTFSDKAPPTYNCFVTDWQVCENSVAQFYMESGLRCQQHFDVQTSWQPSRYPKKKHNLHDMAILQHDKSVCVCCSGQPLPQVKYLGIQTPHVHNLTDAIRKEVAYGASSLKSEPPHNPHSIDRASWTSSVHSRSCSWILITGSFFLKLFIDM